MSITAEKKHIVNARYVADPPLILVKLEHPDWPVNILLVENDTAITSNGVQFEYAQCSVVLPSESDIASRGNLIFGNVFSQHSNLILSVGPTIKCTLQIVMASQPDSVIKEFSDLNLENVQMNNRFIAGELVREDYEAELWPPRVLNVDEFPGIGW